MSDYIEINGYLIRRAENAQSASDIGFILPKDKKSFQREEKVQAFDDVGDLVESIRLELSRFTNGKDQVYKNDVFRQYFNLELSQFNELRKRTRKYLERKLEQLKQGDLYV